jgi:molybdate transport system substrate-binding protein
VSIQNARPARFCARLAGLFACWLLAAAPAGAEPATEAKSGAEAGPVIAVAASLRVAIDDIARAFQAKTGHALRLTYGSTGNFARQIEQSAPFELFLSADTETVDRLVAAGATDGPGIVLVRGRLAFIAGAKSSISADPELKGFRAALADGSATKVAIANPELAPYGQAAKEVLVALKLIDTVSPRLVLGENVAQAAQFVSSGAAPCGFVAASLLAAPALREATVSALVPENLHSPLDQSMVVLKTAGPVAREFFQFLQGPEASATFERVGFAVPRT